MSEKMKKVELLSPAGSYESAIAGIQNGCDAIYMAGMQFGARAFASNFDNEKIIEIVKYAHAYGVKVYITLNTLIHDDECEACFKYIDFLYQSNVDALIVQDLGIVSYLRTKYPDFEVHASTQMHIVNESALLFLKEIGVTRAVLAREVKIEEIKRFSKHDIELEVFVHGALCVSYSGQCLMSSMIGGRSGNRGECAQTCRMPYVLSDYHSKKEFGKPAYLLSLMDLNTLDHVKALKDANVTSFKIEGRMKKSEYVGHITSLYRRKIDHDDEQISQEDMDIAKMLFHRGYTAGFLNSQRGSKLYNPYRPNHIGITIGKVVGYHKGNVQIYLTQPIHQGDGIRILNEKGDYGFKVNRLYVNGLLANRADAFTTVEIECHEKVNKGCKVVKTSDPMIEKQIRESYEFNQRRVPVNMFVEAHSGDLLQLIISDGLHTITVQSEEYLEKANRRATTKEEISKQLNKVNDTIFKVDYIEINMYEELFIPIKIINQLRRDGLNMLYETRSNEISRTNIPFTFNDVTTMQHLDKIYLNAKVLNEEQLLACLDQVDSVYVCDCSLYEKYKDDIRVKLCSSKVAKEKEDYHNVSMIQEIGGIYALEHFECDTSLNVYNAYTMHFLKKMGATLISFSHELKSFEIKMLMEQYKSLFNECMNTQFVAYGRVEVMVSEHCPINASLVDNDKKNCQLCRNQTYALKDKFNNYFPMCNDLECRMHLYDYKTLNHIGNIKELLAAGVNHIRLDFTFETIDEVNAIINKTKDEMYN